MEALYTFILALLMVGLAVSVMHLRRALFALKTAKETADVLLRERDGLLAEKAATAPAVAETKAALERAREDVRALSIAHAAAQEREKALREKLETQAGEVANVRAALQKDFELLAQKIFDQTQQKLLGASGEQLSSSLKPLRENLQAFTDRVNKINDTQTEARTRFEEQIKQLSELNQRMNAEAAALTRALKSDNKAAGNWGEMVLKNLLDFCGLTEGREYETQASAQTEEGRRLQPDVVVKLPGGKFIIIDSKVSLLSYTEAARAADEAAAAPYKKAFVESVRRHIEGLSKKNYPGLAAFGNNPEYVLMFIPIEQAFYLLTQESPDIYEYAIARKVVPVTPATLLSTLKTIEFVWRTEKQNINALEIAEVGARVRAEIENFLGLFDNLGDALRRAQKAYTDTQDKLYDAQRNTLKKAAEDLEELGVKAKKRLTSPRAPRLPSGEDDTAEPPTL